MTDDIKTLVKVKFGRRDYCFVIYRIFEDLGIKIKSGKSVGLAWEEIVFASKEDLHAAIIMNVIEPLKQEWSPAMSMAAKSPFKEHLSYQYARDDGKINVDY